MGQISLNSPVGNLTIFDEDDAIVVVAWGPAPEDVQTPLLSEAKRQLESYFGGGLTEFDLPLRPAGSQFQQAVCNAAV